MDLLKPITGQLVSSSKNESNQVDITFKDDEKHLEEFYDDIKEKNKLMSISLMLSKTISGKISFKKGDTAVFLFYYDGKGLKGSFHR